MEAQEYEEGLGLGVTLRLGFPPSDFVLVHGGFC